MSLHQFKCKACEHSFEEIIDHGEGQTAHRREICKQRGLTPVDGDYDEEKIFSEFDNRRKSEEKEYNDYIDRMDNAPEFSALRKAQEQGRI